MYERTRTPPGHDATPNPTLHAERQAGGHRVPLLTIFGLTRQGIEPRSPGYRADTLRLMYGHHIKKKIVFQSVKCLTSGYTSKASDITKSYTSKASDITIQALLQKNQNGLLLFSLKTSSERMFS